MIRRTQAWLVAALLGIAWTVAPSSTSRAQGEISGGVVKLGVLIDETGVLSTAPMSAIPPKADIDRCDRQCH